MLAPAPAPRSFPFWVRGVNVVMACMPDDRCVATISKQTHHQGTKGGQQQHTTPSPASCWALLVGGVF